MLLFHANDGGCIQVTLLVLFAPSFPILRFQVSKRGESGVRMIVPQGFGLHHSQAEDSKCQP
jgi:hypothetical protein